MKSVETLKIEHPILSDLSDDPVLNAIEKFSHHARILKIKQAIDTSDCFSFKLVTIQYICKKILPLDASKAHQTNDMATKVIKNNSRIFPKCFQANLNNTNETSAFLDHLKYADF